MSSENSTPNKIGRYDVLSVLGRGAMGVVYLARDPEIGREVAIKTLRRVSAAEIHDADAALERYRSEARSAGKLRHPNIITIFEANRDGETPYLVMDYVRGQGLDEVIAAHGKLEALTALNYLAQAAAGLDYAHNSGVIHRDIKPSNILVGEAGVVYISDFGVALIERSIVGEEQGPQTSELVVGSPAYMSPEQILNKKLEASSDLFSFAVVAFECLTGQRPFLGDSFTAVAGNIINGKFQSLSDLAPEMPLAAEAQFERAFANDPKKRFMSAQELVIALSEALGIPVAKQQVSIGKVSERERKKTSGWKSLAPNKEMLPDSGKGGDMPASGPGGFKSLADVETGQTTIPRTAPRSDSGPEPRGAAHFRGRGDLVYQGPSFREKVILLLAFFFVVSGIVILVTFWKDIAKSSGRSSSSTAAKNVAKNAAAQPQPVEPKILTEPVPSGVSVRELNDRQLLGAIVSNAESDLLVIQALGEARRRGLSDLIWAALRATRQHSFVVRVEAIKIVGELRDRRAVASLSALLADPDPLVRGNAAKALGNIGDSSQAAALESLAKSDPVSEVRTAAAKAVFKLQGDR